MGTPVHPARHLICARDLVDTRYREPLDVDAMAAAAKLSPAHFSREFRRAFGETPHHYLLTQVWGPGYGGDAGYLKVFVRRLRHKLGDDVKHPHYIQTEWGIGYRFVAPGPRGSGSTD